MATLYKQGRAWAIQFRDKYGRIQTMRVGRMTAHNARQVKIRVESLIGSHLSATAPDAVTADWARNTGDHLRGQLARVGLIDAVSNYTVGRWLDEYAESKKPAVSAWTYKRLINSIKAAKRILDADKHLLAVTAADAEQVRDKMIAEGYAEATIGRMLSDYKSIFGRAVKARLIAANPFEGVSTKSPGAKDRTFITAETAALVMAELPDTKWRLMFALGRWGGLRMPSEIKDLRWDDIAWGEKRITIRQPKKKGESRVVPLFLEVEAALLDHRERAGDDPLVLPGMESAEGARIRKPLEQAIKRAGVKQWKRLWHELRSTRQTELERDHPTHVVCAWLGNSPKIAAKHYLQVTDDDFNRAVLPQVNRDSSPVQSPAR